MLNQLQIAMRRSSAWPAKRISLQTPDPNPQQQQQRQSHNHWENL